MNGSFFTYKRNQKMKTVKLIFRSIIKNIALLDTFTIYFQLQKPKNKISIIAFTFDVNYLKTKNISKTINMLKNIQKLYYI